MDALSLTQKILFDYFDGKSSSIQRKMVEEWLSNPANNELYFRYLDEWEQQHPQYVVDINAGLLKVNQHIDNPFNEQRTVKTALISKNAVTFYTIGSWLSAAIVILVAGWFGWNQLTKPKPVTYDKLVKLTKATTGEIFEKVNVTNDPILINLPDNSSIILQPKSKICYSPKQYNKSKREIILSGEAFFEVQKNPDKPFFVYTNELVTKVLGTSFLIKSQQSNANVEVIVKTGKVAVFLQHDPNKSKKLADNSLNGLVLKANEQVKINGSDFTIEKPTFVNQEQLSLPIQKLSFNFDDAPATEVLSELEKAYNINIIFDSQKIANCKLTAHLSDEPLMEKLELICTALEATYKEVDSKIILQTKGCQ